MKFVVYMPYSFIISFRFHFYQYVCVCARAIGWRSIELASKPFDIYIWLCVFYGSI
jgi:hypothetical protein